MPKKKQSTSRQAERMIHVRLKNSTHRLLRVRAAEDDVTIQEWVTSLIERALNNSSGGREEKRCGN